ncbi:hypothetical protein D0Z00_003196 [Geotrichum galactomycetum]|uniref:Uncharacterized protein n=1 Tax=Geotrichum galactomycetum TaxID=27317 RepID=A0ACB6V201_9ASCO|nr:hypothetical protein D0Z00_003196 [Geotrichum candidum]
MADTEEQRLRAFMPSAFGKTEESAEDARLRRYDQALRSEYKKQQEEKQETAANKSNESDSDSEDEYSDDEDLLPISHELVLSGHTKSISAITLDSSGSRLVAASYDTFLNYWDFNGMDPLARAPFRQVEPLETHQLRTAAFAPHDDNTILVVPRFTRPKLYSREGVELAEFASGDMYLVDMNNTKGHVAELTHGAWSPADRNAFATAAIDSTVRIWDVNNTRKQKSVIVVRAGGARGNKTRVATLGYTHLGESLLAGTTDGSIGMWNAKGPFLRPAQFVEQAHDKGAAVTSIVASPDGVTLATRASDGTVKLWDTRQFKTPVMSRAGIIVDFEDSNLAFDPAGKYVLAGAAHGQLHILDKSDLSTLHSLHVPGADDQRTFVTTATWHPALNQIFVGLSNGVIHGLFSPELSKRGCKTVVEKAPRRRHVDDDAARTVSISAIGLEEGISRREAEQEAKHRAARQRKAAASQAVASPNPDGTYPSQPAQERKVWGTPDQEHVRKNVPLSHLVHEDPREALLKYAKRAQQDHRFKSELLAANSPAPTTTTTEDEDGEEDDNQPERKRAKN